MLDLNTGDIKGDVIYELDFLDFKSMKEFYTLSLDKVVIVEGIAVVERKVASRMKDVVAKKACGVTSALFH